MRDQRIKINLSFFRLIYEIAALGFYAPCQAKDILNTRFSEHVREARLSRASTRFSGQLNSVPHANASLVN